MIFGSVICTYNYIRCTLYYVNYDRLAALAFSSASSVCYLIRVDQHRISMECSPGMFFAYKEISVNAVYMHKTVSMPTR